MGIAALAIAVITARAYGPRLIKHAEILRLQRECLRAALPSDRPVFEQDAPAANALLRAWPGEYWSANSFAVRPDSRWRGLAVRLGLGDPISGKQPWATFFVHERRTPSGQRRLVVVEDYLMDVTVIEPAGLLTPARVKKRERMKWDAPSDRAFMEARNLTGPNGRVGAGTPDVGDPSRFSVPVTIEGVTATVEYRLEEDDRVTIRLRDAEAFATKVAAAVARKAAGPATRPGSP